MSIGFDNANLLAVLMYGYSYSSFLTTSLTSFGTTILVAPVDCTIIVLDSSVHNDIGSSSTTCKSLSVLETKIL